MRRERPKKVHLSSQGKRDVFHKLITFPIFYAYRSRNCKKSPLIDNSSIFLRPEQKNLHINQLIDTFKFFCWIINSCLSFVLWHQVSFMEISVNQKMFLDLNNFWIGLTQCYLIFFDAKNFVQYSSFSLFSCCTS